MDSSYYRSQSQDMKDLLFIEQEKLRLRTRKWIKITEIITRYKEKAYNTRCTTGKVLQGIFEKNKLMALEQIPFKKKTNIPPLVARTETLLLAYRRIKKNKGAMAKAANVSADVLMGYTNMQREIYYRKKIFPDGFSLRDVDLTGYLLLKGKYPWGSSRRIYVTKPGAPGQKLRPLTIPPFLDRVVQEAIKMVLQAIWEPDFELLNRSFGFRPNKSSHDAITAIKSNFTSDLSTKLT
jgi:hypothetical protein